MGVMFTAADYAAASGREPKTSALRSARIFPPAAFCSAAAPTARREYHQLAEAHGIWEYNMNNYEKDDGAYPAIHTPSGRRHHLAAVQTPALLS